MFRFMQILLLTVSVFSFAKSEIAESGNVNRIIPNFDDDKQVPSNSYNEEYRQLMLNLQIRLLQNQINIFKYIQKIRNEGSSSNESINEKYVSPKKEDPPITTTSSPTQQSNNDSRIVFPDELGSTPVEPTEGDCFVNQSANLQYLVLGQPVFNHIQNGFVVNFICNNQTSLVGVNSTLCINGELLDEIPTCQILKPTREELLKVRKKKLVSLFLTLVKTGQCEMGCKILEQAMPSLRSLIYPKCQIKGQVNFHIHSDEDPFQKDSLLSNLFVGNCECKIEMNGTKDYGCADNK